MKTQTLSAVLVSGSLTLALGIACSETRLAPPIAEMGFNDLADSDRVVAEVEELLRPFERAAGAMQDLKPGEALYSYENSPLYAAPDSTAAPERCLPLGATVFAVEQQGEWARVALPGGERGWMLTTDLVRAREAIMAARSDGRFLERWPVRGRELGVQLDGVTRAELQIN